jgi:hypothetical protein
MLGGLSAGLASGVIGFFAAVVAVAGVLVRWVVVAGFFVVVV